MREVYYPRRGAVPFIHHNPHISAECLVGVLLQLILTGALTEPLQKNDPQYLPLNWYLNTAVLRYDTKSMAEYG